MNSKIKPINPNGNRHRIFIERTDAKAPILWPPDAKSWLIGKDSDAGKDWGQEEKGTTEDEMVGWHHCLDAHDFEHAPGDGEGQGSLSMGLQRVRHDWVTEQQQGSYDIRTLSGGYWVNPRVSLYPYVITVLKYPSFRPPGKFPETVISPREIIMSPY